MSCSEEVILEIEGTPVKCKRDVLISNSDYFKAMLEGNFIEKDQKTISIKDVDLKAVNIILTLLGDPRNDTEDEDVLMILHAACMLQFCEIRNMCLDKLNQILSVQNCLKVWIMAEQLELKPLVLKAKRLALTEFMSIIKENDSINDLNLQQLIRYIGSVHLVTDSELTVFQTLMKWWYDHSKDHTSDDFIKLLSCVNYKQLLPDHFREILTYPDLAITEVEDILKCLYNLLNNIPNISCSKKCLKVASVLSQSNDRKIIIDSVPCLLVRNSSNDVPNKKRLVENNEIGVDKSKLRVVYYDRKLGVFRRFVNISEEVEKQFRRFILKGYKEYIFLFGGEHLVHVPGDVERKYSLLIYDSIKEIWITKTRMPFPFPRTHFEACIVGSKVFISGSIGKNRFIPANIFYYDYKTNEWSEQYTCPQRILERSYKCCNYLDKFLVFSLYKKCACVFEDSGFTIWPVVFPPTLHHDTKKIWVECGNFSLFAYKDRLYLKEIEGTPVKCKKDVLISNSDYFKAMLEGNFIEKDQETICIKDVDLKAINIILTLLWDPTIYIEDEDVLMVLHAACMLQFCEIRNMCLDKLIQILCVQNCLKIWIITEQLDIKPLFLKAKRLALAEFMMIKETDSINDLNLEQLIRYIGSLHLVTDSELTVFQTLMKWWYDHSKDHTSDDFIKLLSCVNYKQLLPDHFREIRTYPDLANTEVEDILKCLYNILNNIPNGSCSEKYVEVATRLSQSNDRKIDSVPCLLVLNSYDDVPNKKRLVENNQTVVDRYKRKIVYKIFVADKSNLHLVYYDRKLDIFRGFINIFKRLEGFRLRGYKEYIFLFGGEYVLGKGEWNYTFWVYDSIKDMWRTKSRMPFPRRHFETCIVGSKVFVSGGIGQFRIIQSNVFWYDYKTDEWSKQYQFPQNVFGRSYKCCNYLDKFLIFSVNKKCAYFFDENSGWTILPLVFPPTLDHDIKNMQTESGKFSLFAYKDRLYVKGKEILEMKMVRDGLEVISVKTISTVKYDELEETVCDNILYTLYKQHTLNGYIYSFEKYNLDTHKIEIIFKKLKEEDSLYVEGELLNLDQSLNIFSFSHHSLFDENQLVNKNF
ncbi:uncharacterized protein LOC126888403 isoform X2 [Diabrotica virgifera virgifera]|uniref:BTB domain-containing protein n=1 Tax=Diabrotica virgifera virgifera TaxID=50390 RepID=A0ABM5KQY9_DIAVI|nr:uncharacterized protein LOC126888403 isoform X2 [Diabrotica virgifera virgifera]